MAISFCSSSSSSSSWVLAGLAATAGCVGTCGSFVVGIGAGSSICSSNVYSVSLFSSSSRSSSSISPAGPMGCCNASDIYCSSALVSAISSITVSTFSMLNSFMVLFAAVAAEFMTLTTSTVVRWLSSIIRYSFTRRMRFSTRPISSEYIFFFFSAISAWLFLSYLVNCFAFSTSSSTLFSRRSFRFSRVSSRSTKFWIDDIVYSAALFLGCCLLPNTPLKNDIAFEVIDTRNTEALSIKSGRKIQAKG